jgi:hypothetical protein
MTQESTPKRDEMINFLLDRAYPCTKKGRRIGHGDFYRELCEQPTRVVEALYESAKKEKERRAEWKKGLP